MQHNDSSFDTLQFLASMWSSSDQITATMDVHYPGWALPTATPHDWDVLTQVNDRCPHPTDKRRTWPMDYKRSYCCLCGEETP